MKIVILTRTAPRHIYFANRILKEAESVGIVVEKPGIAISSKSANDKKEFSYLKICLNPGKIKKYIRDKVTSYVNKRETIRNERIFNNKYYGRFWYSLIKQAKYKYSIYRCSSINDPLTIEFIKSFNPDLLVVLGTSLLSKQVLDIPKLGALNIHTGVSPYYRGVYCLEWAIYNEDLDNIGVTLHYVNSGIDSGSIIHIGKPELNVNDTRESIFAKLITIGTDLMIQSIREIKNDEVKTYPQDKSLGKLYLQKDYNMEIEKTVNNKIKEGVVRKYLENNITISNV